MDTTFHLITGFLKLDDQHAASPSKAGLLNSFSSVDLYSYSDNSVDPSR